MKKSDIKILNNLKPKKHEINFRRPNFKNAKEQAKVFMKINETLCPKCESTNTECLGSMTNNISPHYTVKDMKCKDCKKEWKTRPQREF